MLEVATAARQDGAARRDSDRIDESFRLACEALRAALAEHAPNVTGLSCLADGADQVFARAVTDLGGTLEAVIPAAEYREKLPLGLLLRAAWLGWPGAVLLGAGPAAHLAMLVAHLRHGRRRSGLLTVFVLTSAAWLLTGAGLGLAADLVQARRAALAAAAVTALAGWLLEALVGHALHVVSLIAWPTLSNRMAAGARPVRPGSPGLYIPALAVTAYGTLTAARMGMAIRSLMSLAS